MKKIISTILSILITFISIQTTIFAEEQQVEGLHEKLNTLFIKNNFTEEQLTNMKQQIIDDFDERWDGRWKGLKALGKNKSNNEKLEYEYRLNEIMPDFDYSFLITLLKENALLEKYPTQYIKKYTVGKIFNYLFDNKQYWTVATLDGTFGALRFDLNGNRIKDMKEILGSAGYILLILDKNHINFLKDEKNIHDMLLKEKEYKVDDIRIFAFDQGKIFTYIKCGQNEYLIKLRATSGSSPAIENIPQFEQYKLYPASEVINALAEEWDYIAAEKPTYETEALSLQSEGLLNGNDNGLDLLKPLTRIEAAAMLLRAIGETEIAPEGATQAFNDVPSTHWGFGAAINAQALGIVNGVGDNNFAPDKTVTATEFSTMVLRAANTGEFDWTQALNMLIEQGIITQENSETMDLFTRGDMAKIIYEARNKGLLN